MFAKRTEWLRSLNPLMARLKKAQKSGQRILDLTESNPTRCGFAFPSPKIQKALLSPKNIFYEPSPQGLLRARERVALYYKKNGFHVSPAQIFLTASTSEAYAFLFRLLLEPGEAVLVPRPSYPLFQFLAEINDVEIKNYPLHYDGSWQIDFDALKNAVTSKTKSLILVNPNNPTGSYVKKEELSKINRLAEEKRLALIADEVFWDYRIKAGVPVAGFAQNSEVLTFTLNGISKILALPQMKIGWIVVSGPAKEVKAALERLEIIADTYLSVNTPAQNALSSWLLFKNGIQNEITGRLKKNYSTLKTLIQKSKTCEALSLEGGWYAVLRLPRIHSDEEWAIDFLEKDRVFVHPGYFFDFEKEGYIVISLLPRPRDFEEGMRRLLQRVNKTL